MADPLAVIIRFRGDPDGLLSRFEDVRRSWIDRQEGGYERPVFYAACREPEGIAVVTVWEGAVGHRAFGQQLHGLIDAAGLPHPEQIERMKVDRLGWD